MLTAEDYGRIRRLRRDGVSLRAGARPLRDSRRKLRAALPSAEPHVPDDGLSMYMRRTDDARQGPAL